jgi:hypothetical protein
VLPPGTPVQAEVGQIRRYRVGNTVGFLSVESFFGYNEALRLRLEFPLEPHLCHRGFIV